jgi:hypothetical protein
MVPRGRESPEALQEGRPLPAATAPETEGRPPTYDHRKLRAWREQSGLTRTQASHAVGMSYPWLADLEAGRARNPTFDILARLAVLYGHDAGELLPGRVP